MRIYFTIIKRDVENKHFPPHNVCMYIASSTTQIVQFWLAGSVGKGKSSTPSFCPINIIQRTMPIIKNRRAEGGNGNGRNKSGKIRCGLVQVHTPPVNPKDLYTLLSWMRGNLLSFYYTFFYNSLSLVLLLFLLLFSLVSSSFIHSYERTNERNHHS